MSELQTISVTVGILTACITVIVGVISFVKSNQRAEEQRQTQLFMDLYNRWNTRDMAKQYGRTRYDYHMTTETWSKNIITTREDGTWTLADPETYADFQSMSEFFEGIGVLVKRKLIDTDVVEDLLPNRIIWWWETIKPISELARKNTGDSKLHDHTEYLYHEMKQRQQAANVA